MGRASFSLRREQILHAVSIVTRVLFEEEGAAQYQIAWSFVNAQPDVGIEFCGLAFTKCQIGLRGFAG